MTSLYSWLRFVHLLGLALFLFGHGITAGTSLTLRARPDPAVSWGPGGSSPPGPGYQALAFQQS